MTHDMCFIGLDLILKTKREVSTFGRGSITPAEIPTGGKCYLWSAQYSLVHLAKQCEEQVEVISVELSENAKFHGM